MQSLLTRYAAYFNRRDNRSGKLFTNRFKSVLCDRDDYLLQLVRYIHLNPLRARLVSDMDELDRYLWTGHSTYMGIRKDAWLGVSRMAVTKLVRRGAEIESDLGACLDAG